MREQELKRHIAGIRNELDTLLAAGDRESILKTIALLKQTWHVVFSKDDGIRYTAWFQDIWMEEMVKGEVSIFEGIHSVDEVLNKANLTRHALFRLENDFPLDLCLDALDTISGQGISQTAFNQFLEREIENSDKVLARINEITASFS